MLLNSVLIHLGNVLCCTLGICWLLSIKGVFKSKLAKVPQLWGGRAIPSSRQSGCRVQDFTLMSCWGGQNTAPLRSFFGSHYHCLLQQTANCPRVFSGAESPLCLGVNHPCPRSSPTPKTDGSWFKNATAPSFSSEMTPRCVLWHLLNTPGGLSPAAPSSDPLNYNLWISFLPWLGSHHPSHKQTANTVTLPQGLPLEQQIRQSLLRECIPNHPFPSSHIPFANTCFLNYFVWLFVLPFTCVTVYFLPTTHIYPHLKIKALGKEELQLAYHCPPTPPCT